MRKVNIFFICLLLLPVLIHPEEIKRETILFYDNELSSPEKKLLDDALDNRIDSLKFIEAYFISSGIADEAELNELVKHYESKNGQIEKDLTAKSNPANTTEKNIADMLCRLMHTHILSKYDFDAIFPSPLVNNGIFNCVSSSAVYADLLKRHGIDYVFGGVETHVFLYARIDGNEILCEPTNELGFDAGNNVKINPDGSWQSAGKPNYTNIRKLNEIEFLATMFYDARIITLPENKNPAKLYLISKKGLYMNPGDEILILNYKAFSYDYVQSLMKARDFENGTRILCDSIKIINNKEYRKNLVYLLETPLADYYRNSGFDSADKLVSLVRDLADNEIFSAFIEYTHDYIAYNFIRENSLDKAKFVIEKGLSYFPKSSQLTKRNQEIVMMITQGNQNLSEIFQSYSDLIEKSPDDKKIKNNLVAQISPILIASLKKGEYEKVDKSIIDLAGLAGDFYKNQLVDIIYRNSVYDTLNDKQYTQAIEISHQGLKWGKNKNIINNYLAGISEYVEEIFRQNGIIRAHEVFINEMKFAKEYTDLKSQYRNSMTNLFEKELLEKGSGNLLPILNDKSLIDMVTHDVMNSVINNSFGNAMYDLCGKKNFSEALKIGNTGLGYGKFPLVQKNYVYALQEAAKERVRQKDTTGALDLIVKSLKDFPDIPKIQNVPSTVFRRTIVEFLKSGNFTETENIFTKFKGIMSEKELQDFQDDSYLTASYEFINEKSYDKAVFAAKKRLLVSFSQKLFGNFKIGLYNLYLSNIETADYVKMINDYNEYNKAFKNQNVLTGDLGNLIIKKGRILSESDEYQKINDMLKRFREKADDASFENTASTIFINASYEKIKIKKYEDALDIAENGFIWTKNRKLINNYIAAFENLGKIYKSSGDKKKLSALLARIKKALPEDSSIKKFEESYF